MKAKDKKALEHSRKPKVVRWIDGKNGFSITYVKTRQSLSFYAWAGETNIPGKTLTLQDFCQTLGITRDDLKEVTSDVKTGNQG